MIPWLGGLLEPFFGPFRLFSSRLLLLGLGATAAARRGPDVAAPSPGRN